jgi:hypothetical protein
MQISNLYTAMDTPAPRDFLYVSLCVCVCMFVCVGRVGVCVCVGGWVCHLITK